ncbi:MAG TPA: hypothetical protein C5S37_02420 [Methanophagales archaeon]|nr:hypothetical protein [Methanophagales archaeon]
MKGDGEGESEGARENGYGKPNNDIKVTRRAFVKTTAAFGAAVAGSPYNLTDITDVFLKEDGELIIYPVISEIEYKLVRELAFERIICIKPWGCNWNCRWCPMKIAPYEDMRPVMISIDRIIGLLPYLGADIPSTMIAISGGEPLLQKEEVLKLISSLKVNNYTVMLFTNGCLIEEGFIDKANEVGLDQINISFYALDDKLHRWYTGYSNEDTINALKLVTERFEGLITVSIVLFDYIDMASLGNICEFLHKINPNFIIRIACPIHDAYEHEKCNKEKRHEAEEIASRYFSRMVKNEYFSEKIIMGRYQIEKDESGYMKLVKSWEYERTKEAMKYE